MIEKGTLKEALIIKHNGYLETKADLLVSQELLKGKDPQEVIGKRQIQTGAQPALVDITAEQGLENVRKELEGIEQMISITEELIKNEK